MELETVVADFYSDTGVSIQCVEEEDREDWEQNHAFNPLTDTIYYSSGTNLITRFNAVGFRIDLGQGVSISGSLPSVTVAEYVVALDKYGDGVDDDKRWMFSDAIAIIDAKCGVFNRELME